MSHCAHRALVLALALMTGPTAASAQDLHADMPLWTYDDSGDELFPTRFSDDESFGCSNIIDPGFYRLDAQDDPDAVMFWRITNYGVFHCALTFGIAYEQEEANKTFEGPAWIVKLGDDTVDEAEVELLALQIGIVDGSRYILLRRPKNEMHGLEVLAHRCLRGLERRVAQIDIWRQDSCIVRSKADLRRVAREANRRPPHGRLAWLDENADD